MHGCVWGTSVQILGCRIGMEAGARLLTLSYHRLAYLIMGLAEWGAEDVGVKSNSALVTN